MNSCLALSTIQDYISEALFEAAPSWPKNDFQHRSYERWAAYEICGRIAEESLIEGRPHRKPLDIVAEFKDEMDHCYELSNGSPHRVIFEVAMRTADEIAYMLL